MATLVRFDKIIVGATAADGVIDAVVVVVVVDDEVNGSTTEICSSDTIDAKNEAFASSSAVDTSDEDANEDVDVDEDIVDSDDDDCVTNAEKRFLSSLLSSRSFARCCKP